MTRTDYLKSVQEAFDSGRVNEDTYDCMLQNADVFSFEDDEDKNYLPSTYAEIEYDDFDNAEANLGAKFDDMNYQFYTER